MRKRQSHWPALTYYHPCFDFSESIRANADNVINIHEPSSSLILSAFYIVISGIIRSSFVILSIFPPFFIETLNDKQYLKHHHQYGINFVPIKMNVLFQETYENINENGIKCL